MSEAVGTEQLGGRKNDGKRAMANVDRTTVLLRITWPPLYVDESGLPDNDDMVMMVTATMMMMVRFREGGSRQECNHGKQ
jgi:hypothetical protein